MLEETLTFREPMDIAPESAPLAPDAAPLPDPTMLSLQDPASITRMDMRTVFLGGIFIILTLAMMRIASEIVMPVVLAFILKLVFHPVLRFMEKLHLPRRLSAVAVLLLLLCGIVGLGTVLSQPAANWITKFPESVPEIRQQLNFLRKPVEKTQKVLVQADELTKGTGPKVMSVSVEGTRFSDKVFIGTQAFLSSLFTTMILFFFLLASGDIFLRRLVEVLPRFKDKRQAVDISQQIEHDISAYLLTITTMNAGVGIATGLMMWSLGVSDALLCGTIAFLLNYVPILGPIICAVLFALVGMLAGLEDGSALLPALLYFIIHLLEGSLITPLFLAKRFTLNPVLVVFSLVFWYWMWGFAGAILAVPMLAILKIICDRIEKLAAFGHFLEG